jgi:hypothetical protein
MAGQQGVQQLPQIEPAARLQLPVPRIGEALQQIGLRLVLAQAVVARACGAGDRPVVQARFGYSLSFP